MDGWVDEWKDRWIGGWVDGWSELASEWHLRLCPSNSFCNQKHHGT